LIDSFSEQISLKIQYKKKDTKMQHAQLQDETESTEQIQTESTLEQYHEHAHPTYRPWRSIKEFLQTIRPKWKEVKSKESLIRDLLAAERTFLAWVRTALAIVSLGIAIVRLLEQHKLQVVVKAMGAFFVFSGLVVFVYSWLRYQLMTKKMEDGVFTVDSVSSSLALIFGVVASIFAFILVFA
jgi:putative membrane protein